MNIKYIKILENNPDKNIFQLIYIFRKNLSGIGINYTNRKLTKIFSDSFVQNYLCNLFI